MATKKTHRRTKKARPAVRGPQLQLPAVKGAPSPDPTRTVRLRYLEKPTKKDGNPFFALRVPSDLLDAFKKLCAKRDVEPTAVVRAYIAKWSGVKLEVAHGDE